MATARSVKFDTHTRICSRDDPRQQCARQVLAQESKRLNDILASEGRRQVAQRSGLCRGLTTTCRNGSKSHSPERDITNNCDSSDGEGAWQRTGGKTVGFRLKRAPSLTRSQSLESSRSPASNNPSLTETALLGVRSQMHVAEPPVSPTFPKLHSPVSPLRARRGQRLGHDVFLQRSPPLAWWEERKLPASRIMSVKQPHREHSSTTSVESTVDGGSCSGRQSMCVSRCAMSPPSLSNAQAAQRSSAKVPPGHVVSPMAGYGFRYLPYLSWRTQST